MDHVAHGQQCLAERHREHGAPGPHLLQADSEVLHERGVLEPTAGEGAAVGPLLACLRLCCVRHVKATSQATLSGMATATRNVAEVCASAKRASRELAIAGADRRNAALGRLADLLTGRSDEVLEANAADLADERAAGLTEALRDRLTVNAERVISMAEGVRAVAALEDPVRELIEERTLASGLRLRKVRVPLGVVAVIYEARPNVTVDCAALTLKSGNAIVLRGSSYAAGSNAALAALVREAVAEAGLPEGSVELLEGGERAELTELATAEGLVDL